MSERKVFTQRSVDEVTNDCSAGHCGCYYSNQNVCCRCNEIQIDRTLIERHIVWDERDYKPKKQVRLRDGKIKGSTWVFDPITN